MRKRLVSGLLAVALVVAGVGAGATAGRFVPGVGQLFGATITGAAALSVVAVAPLSPISLAGSGFTYQGRLKEGSSPANGQYDFQFTLFDALTGGTLIAGPVPKSNQAVSDGLFTVALDFGAGAFNGDARYLDIAVRPAGGGSYVGLSPRQALTPAPYALFALKTKGYKNVVTVAQDGGDFTSVQAALSSITTNNATNKFLVWVGPGTYTEQVTMKPWVDIEGSGEKTTKVTFTGSPSIGTGTIEGASNAELRFLTVENTGGGNYATAISSSSASPSLLNVTVIASGGMASNYGVYSNSSSSIMTNITVIASGGAYDYGIYNLFPSATIKSSVISAIGGTNANYGIYSIGNGTMAIDNSKITGGTNPIANFSGVTTQVGASQLSGGPVFNGGTLSCAASYSSNNTANEPLNANCTTKELIDNVVTVGKSGADFTTVTAALNYITGNSATNKYLVKVGPGVYTEQVVMKQWVDIEGSGELTTKISFAGSPIFDAGTIVGASNAELRSLTVENTGANTYAVAIYNSAASPSLLHVTATASGGSSGIDGVINTSASSPTMSNVTATASGVSNINNGVYNSNSAPIMSNVTATASDGRSNVGVYNAFSSSPGMTNVRATASGGNSAYGVYDDSSSPVMTNVTVAASGATNYNYGVYNNTSSPVITNATVTATGGANNIGVASIGSGTVTINNSAITGSSNAVVDQSGASTRVGASMLSGGPTGPSGVTCAAVYDENYAFYAGTCP